jgi:hypothetical protein
MTQKSWIYLGHGQRYRVTLLHSQKKGYATLYVDQKLIHVFYNVFGDFTTSFFIEDELCKVHIRLKKNGFWYGFEVDEKADTPANKRRRKKFRSDLTFTIIFFSSTIVLCIFAAIVFTKYQHFKSELRLSSTLATNGAYTPAQIILPTAINDVWYQYQIENTVYTFELNESFSRGLPLKHGDQYTVHYARHDPSLHRLRLDLPEPELLDSLIDKTRVVHKSAHPYMAQDRVRCQVDSTFAHFGWQGISHLYQQLTPPSKNKDYNRITSQKLFNSPRYQELVISPCRN